VCELVGGCRTERVRRRQQCRTAVVDLATGELGDRRRLARPVHPDEQPHRRSVRRVVQGTVDAREVVDDLVAQERDEPLGVVHPRRGRPLAQLVE
jgi:hypothetical protein